MDKTTDKILIIEDDEAIAAIERDYLEINNYETATESDGEAGIKRALAENFALILLDLMLPGADGFTVCRKLREKIDVPILMVTARKEDVDKIRGLGLGADDYIVKPFSPSELVARVAANIAAYKRIKGDDGQNREIAIGAISVNPKSRRVFAYDKEVELKKREFDLLLFLMTNADTVFSKEALYDRLWGYESGDAATVTVHINRLREKIERNPSKPVYIQTVWGAGYRFKA